MSETTILWMFGTLIAMYGGWLAYLTTGNTTLSMKVTRIETTLMMINESAMKMLHNDDDRFDLDVLIDKYVDRHYELTHEEWKQLLKRLEVVMNNKDYPRDARLAAAMSYHLCRHKLLLEPDKTIGVK